MGRKLKTAPKKPNSEGKCCHYWIIESPNGPTSRGVCKFCGAEKEFDNYGPDARWYGDISELVVPDLPDLTPGAG